MDSTASDLLDDLTTNIDDLTTTLKPLLSQPIATTASSYSEVEKAKLFTLTTYAIESILLAYQRINNAAHPEDASKHDIISELKRVQTYMQRIDRVEKGLQKGEIEEEAAPEKPKGRHTKFEGDYKGVDTAAAGRFVKHGLAGNEKYDEERAKRQDDAKAAAKRKLEEMGVKDAPKKKSKRSKESVLNVREEDLELVKASSSDAPRKEKSKKKKKSKGGEDVVDLT